MQTHPRGFPEALPLVKATCETRRGSKSRRRAAVASVSPPASGASGASDPSLAPSSSPLAPSPSLSPVMSRTRSAASTSVSARPLCRAASSTRAVAARSRRESTTTARHPATSRMDAMRAGGSLPEKGTIAAPARATARNATTSSTPSSTATPTVPEEALPGSGGTAPRARSSAAAPTVLSHRRRYDHRLTGCGGAGCHESATARPESRVDHS